MAEKASGESGSEEESHDFSFDPGSQLELEVEDTCCITGESIEMNEEQFTDLCVVHLCDWLEQLPRLKKWDFRRGSYRKIAERLGGIALSSYDRVYANEPTAPATSA